MSAKTPHLALAAWLALAGAPLLAAPGPRVAGPRAPSSPPAATAPEPIVRLWSHLTRLFSAIGRGTDRAGLCATSAAGPVPPTVTPPTSADIGAIIDPDG